MKNSKNYTVITGASSGIGYATAKAFAQRAKNLIVVARRQAQLEKLKKEILECDPALDIVVNVCDLSIPSNAHQLYQELKEYPIETWINNAGFGNYGSVALQDLSKIETMLVLRQGWLSTRRTIYMSPTIHGISFTKSHRPEKKLYLQKDCIHLPE